MSGAKVDASKYAAVPLSPEEVVARCRWRSDAIEAYAQALDEYGVARGGHNCLGLPFPPPKPSEDVFRRLNAALIAKWGERALTRIKVAAWKRVRPDLMPEPSS